ncbi:peptidase E [Lapillicoccus sp.]|uniref:Type 1 glutamine amidotransferase-like domain-containing protein n=1 Tax=Lapillicoccus sp. TaxID=1909287 RepID=UPI0025F8C3FE|nr:peptidase E [Lapillicoccus sp.]
MVDHRQIFAFSGLLTREGDRLEGWHLIDHALSLVHPADPVRRGDRQTRVCYVPTAVGDSAEAIRSHRETFARRRPDVDLTVLTLFLQPSVPDVRAHLLEQDLVLVEGGSVVNLMAVWRAHGLPAILRECWEAGVVLAGASAGSICWHTGGPTDSFGDDLAPFTDGLGLLPFSNGVHDDFDDQPRRATYRRLVAEGVLDAGYAGEDGVGLHYVGTRLHEAVTLRPRSTAWWVEPDGSGGWREERVPTRALGGPTG